MYPAPAPNQWNPEDPENVRYSPVEAGAYPPRDPQTGFPPRRDYQPPNGFPGREEENRNPYREGPERERYDPREDDYRYAREDVGLISLNYSLPAPIPFLFFYPPLSLSFSLPFPQIPFLPPWFFTHPNHQLSVYASSSKTKPRTPQLSLKTIALVDRIAFSSWL